MTKISEKGVGIYLKSQGYQVFMAADGVESLEVLDQEEIHLAIVDIMMPRMDGITNDHEAERKARLPCDHAFRKVRGSR